MYSDSLEVLMGFVLGLFFGIVTMLALDSMTNDHLSVFPGLKDQLVERRDDCESRPNVISCEWDEDEVDYVPQDQADG